MARFKFTNDAGVPLRIDPKRIRTNCGCFRIKVDPLQVPPHGEATVEVLVKVPAEEGQFRLGGSVEFQDGESLAASRDFQVVGEAVAPFSFRLMSGRAAIVLSEPSGEEILEFSSKLPVDWKSLTVTSTGTAFRVRRLDDCRFSVVRGELPPDEDRVTGSLTATAVVPGESKMAPIIGRLSIPILAKQKLGLVVKPSEVLLKLNAAGEGQVRLLLRGDGFRGDDFSVAAVRADGYEVQSEIGPSTGGDTRLLKLFFRRTGPAPASGDLALTLRNGMVKKLRLIVP